MLNLCFRLCWIYVLASWGYTEWFCSCSFIVSFSSLSFVGRNANRFNLNDLKPVITLNSSNSRTIKELRPLAKKNERGWSCVFLIRRKLHQIFEEMFVCKYRKLSYSRRVRRSITLFQSGKNQQKIPYKVDRENGS